MIDEILLNKRKENLKVFIKKTRNTIGDIRIDPSKTADEYCKFYFTFESSSASNRENDMKAQLEYFKSVDGDKEKIITDFIDNNIYYIVNEKVKK